MQDEQIAWLRQKVYQDSCHILWTDSSNSLHAVLGFSETRPHIIFIAMGDIKSTNRDAIVEVDIRKLALKDFTVLMKVKIPSKLLDPTPITL